MRQREKMLRFFTILFSHTWPRYNAALKEKDSISSSTRMQKFCMWNRTHQSLQPSYLSTVVLLQWTKGDVPGKYFSWEGNSVSMIKKQNKKSSLHEAFSYNSMNCLIKAKPNIAKLALQLSFQKRVTPIQTMWSYRGVQKQRRIK